MGMARFGINPGKTFGISIPVLRKMAKKIEKDHSFALIGNAISTLTKKQFKPLSKSKKSPTRLLNGSLMTP